MSSTTAISPVQLHDNTPPTEATVSQQNATTFPTPKISQNDQPGDLINAPTSKVKPTTLTTRSTFRPLVKNLAIFVAGFAAGSFAHEISLWSNVALPLIEGTFSAIANFCSAGASLAAAHPVATGGIVLGGVLLGVTIHKIRKVLSPKVKTEFAKGYDRQHLIQAVKVQQNAQKERAAPPMEKLPTSPTNSSDAEDEFPKTPISRKTDLDIPIEKNPRTSSRGTPSKQRARRATK